MTCRSAAVAALLATGMGFALAERGSAQTAQTTRSPLAEDVFKNVQIPRGIPVDEFMDTMGMFSAATGLNCTNCHAADNSTSWDSYAVDTRLKQTARRMLRIVNTINKDSFGGARSITCYTCHRGDQRPRVVPNLAVQDSAPAEDPNEIEAFRTPACLPRSRYSTSIFKLSAARRGSRRSRRSWRKARMPVTTPNRQKCRSKSSRRRQPPARPSFMRDSVTA